MAAMRCLVSIFLLLCSGLSASAQDPRSVEWGVSTFGIYVAPTTQVSSTINLRTPIYVGAYTAGFQSQGNSLTGEIEANSLHVMADYSPRASGWRVSAGIALGGGEISGSATNPELGGIVYRGQFNYQIEQERSLAPVASLGYHGKLRDRWEFSAEMGARFSPVDLKTSGQDALPAGERAQFLTEISQINQSLEKTPVIPFASLGLVMSF